MKGGASGNFLMGESQRQAGGRAQIKEALTFQVIIRCPIIQMFDLNLASAKQQPVDLLASGFDQ
jgi:hypothetical protein